MLNGVPHACSIIDPVNFEKFIYFATYSSMLELPISYYVLQHW